MKKFGLIGKPLSHSFSKKYFTEKFTTLGISAEAEYNNYELKGISDFPSLLQSEPLLAGLNVTIPYKEQVVAFLDELSGAAAHIRAVNTIRILRNQDGSVRKLSGYNTDVVGFEKSFSPLATDGVRGALILGTGGASKAVKYVLTSMKIPFLMVSRQKNDGTITYDQVDKTLLDKYPILINTTPLGTEPNVDSAPPVPYELLDSRNILFDLVYNPPESRFLREGSMRGAITKNGLEMLMLQAEEAWKIWNEEAI